MKILKKQTGFLFSLLLIFSLLSFSSMGQEVIEIQVSPHVLNLQNNGSVVTIHTDIGFSVVNAESVYLNGVEIQSWKADNNGFFVAKFNMDAIQDLPGLMVGELNEFKLEGVTYDGEEFVGYEDVMIIDVSAKKGN
ncbi:MAG: hypothetical protein KAG99_03655 [Bacteroidales bacterium]|nr:hypothetical protein [Bacteroidales bacterium]